MFYEVVYKPLGIFTYVVEGLNLFYYTHHFVILLQVDLFYSELKGEPHVIP